jgi:hypothetical protein
MSAHQAMYPIRTMARVLKVSASGHYAWRSRPASARASADAGLTRHIRTIHARPVTFPGSSRAQKGWYGSKRRRHIRRRCTKFCPQSIAELAIEFGCPNLHHHMRAAY